MKLYQVRKGQFVFYKNELHKVYSVKPVFRKSVHLYRLKDMQQLLTRANKIIHHKPKHGDTFIFYGQRYTIDQDAKPSPGDYILITKPAPDLLSHYALNAIEKVDRLENRNIITTRDNGVKHHEYVMMVPGRKDGAHEIAYLDEGIVTMEQQKTDETVPVSDAQRDMQPIIGEVYFEKQTETNSMVVAITGDNVILGHGVSVKVSELMDEEKYIYVSRLEE